MKKHTLLTVVLAFITLLSIVVSVIAFADDGNTVRLVSMDYVEQSLLPSLQEQIRNEGAQSVRTELDGIQAAIDSLNAALNGGSGSSLGEELAAIKEQIASIENTLGSLADHPDLKKALSLLEQRVSDLEGASAMLQQSVDELLSGMQDLGGRVTSLEETANNLQSELANCSALLSGRLDLTEGNLELLSREQAALKEALDALKSDHSALDAYHTAINERIANLSENADTDRAQLAALQLKADQMSEKLTENSRQYGELIDGYNEYTKTLAALKEASGVGSNAFSMIFLREGEILYCKGLPGDSMELILCRGDLAVVSPIATEGLMDLTDSVELLDGREVSAYHYLLLAGGSDGRGVVSQSGDAWILVRGEYEIG